MTERTLGSVMRDIGGNVDRLARAELRLAVAGLRLRFEAIGEVSVQLIVAAVAAIVTVLFVLLGGMFALSAVMPLWLAALVIALIPATAAVALLVHCRSQLAHGLPPAPREILAGMRGDT